MIKKTLLVAAAALAAGIISSQAQVYSQNVVGYVNQPFKGGGAFNMVCNPLNDTTTNGAEQVITAMVGGETLYIWDKVNGGFFIYNYLGQGSGLTYNWVDAGTDPIPNPNPDGSVPPPQIPPGTGFFYTCAAAETNTYVGNVLNTNSLPLKGGGAINMVSSAIPYAGSIELTNFNAILQGGDSVYVWDTVNGGYFIYNYLGQGSGLTYNWVDAGTDPIPNPNPDGSVPPPLISVGQGFFYTTSTATNWNQSLNIQ